MSYLRLLEQYENIFNTRKLDDLHDLLSGDFHFRNPRIEIFGRDSYIEYEKQNNGLYTTEAVNLTALSENVYLREYYLTFLDSSSKNHDQLHIFETINLKNGLIASSARNYEIKHLTPITHQILNNAANFPLSN